jgi:hypothetical protein
MPVALGVNGGVLGSNNLPSSGSAKGIWTPNEVARAIALGYWPTLYARAIAESASGADALIASTPAEILEAIIASDLISATGAADPYFEYTTLLLPGNGTNGAQNNTFLDGSTNNFTITRNGNTTQGTFSPFSQTGWGNYFNGSSDYLSVASNAALNFGTGDFTVEFWVNCEPQAALYPSAIASLVYPWGVGAVSFQIDHNVNANKFSLYMNGNETPVLVSTSNVCNSAWNHIAVTRSGNTWRCFVNGALENTNTTRTDSVALSTNGTAIGTDGWNGANGYFKGILSNVRIVKCRAVYTSAFTPPTSPLTRTTGGTNPPQGTECSLLTCQSNRFLDSNGPNIPASSPLTITVNGPPSVQAFSPFNPTSAWSASTVAGSGYFDGTGDYLSNTANNIIPSTGDFTFETWIYPTQVSTLQYLLSTTSSNTGNKCHLYINTSAYVGIQTGAAYRDSSTTKVIANAWNHIACTRTGSTYAIFVNGVLQTISGSGTMASSLDNTPTQIGSRDSGISPITGYLSSTRVSNSVLYTVTFTPPTAPFTTGTNLLLNFTNAGIYDATAKNVLETVGNAQVSTTQSKWSPTSMYFDGAGSPADSLLIPASRFFNQLYSTTQSFTLEFWIYQTAYGNPATPFCTGIANGATGWRIDIDSGGTIRWVSNGANTACTSTVSLNTWTYFAYVWNGTTIQVYKGGTAGNSATTSWTNNNDSLLIGRAGISGYDFPFTGYLQDVRLTVGKARTISLPTSAFPVQ